MKETFVEKDFGADALEMIATINGILAEYSEQGYDLSLRQLYYQLVSRNIVPNTASLVRSAVRSVMDVPLFTKNQKEQEKGRKELLKFAKTFLKPKS